MKLKRFRTFTNIEINSFAKKLILLNSLFLSFSLLVFPDVSKDMAHLKLISKKDKVDQSIDKGLAWLCSQQDPSTGKFRGSLPNTITGLACIALMASGQQPGRTEYGENLKKGINFLLRVGKQNGWYFGKEGKGRMYTQGIVTLALCEAYGMMATHKENKKIKEGLVLAIRLIVNAQSKHKGQHNGGWHYEPINRGSADLSVSVWQILVLRSAQNCQIEIPKETLDLAAGYLRRMYNNTRKSFAYKGGHKNTPAMATAGVVGMKVLGLIHTPEDREKVHKSGLILLKVDPNRGSQFYYQSYYLATAANVLGKKYRKEFLPKMERTLLKLQLPSGEFKKHSGFLGGAYSTSFAIICLCVRYQYLPIYQE